MNILDDLLFYCKFNLVTCFSILFVKAIHSNIFHEDNMDIKNVVIGRFECVELYCIYIKHLLANHFIPEPDFNFIKLSNTVFNELGGYQKISHSNYFRRLWNHPYLESDSYKTFTYNSDLFFSNTRILYADDIITNNFILDNYENKRLIDYHKNFIKTYNKKDNLYLLYKHRLNILENYN